MPSLANSKCPEHAHKSGATRHKEMKERGVLNMQRVSYIRKLIAEGHDQSEVTAAPYYGELRTGFSEA